MENVTFTSTSSTNSCLYEVSWVNFCQYSVLAQQKHKRRDHPMTKRIILPGGFGSYENKFYELQYNSTRSKQQQILYTPLEDEYQMWNANLRPIAQNAGNVHAFLLHNNKYLMAMGSSGSNVYDMTKDEWILKNGEIDTTLSDDEWDERRALFINDEILITSYDTNVEFYYVGQNNKFQAIAHPQLLKKYQFKNEHIWYDCHGMVCTRLKVINGDESKLNFDLYLFGGWNVNKSFLDSFVKLNVTLSYYVEDFDSIGINNIINNSNGNCSNYKPKCDFEIKETKISVKDIKCNKLNFSRYIKWFGCQCVMNAKNEEIIIIIGGAASNNDVNKSINLFNTVTHTMTVYDNVCKK